MSHRIRILLTSMAAVLALASTPGCEAVRPAITAGVGALIDCEADHLRAGVAEFLPMARDFVLGLVSGDGRKVDTTRLIAAARALKTDAARCALASAVAILSAPRPASLAPADGPDPGEPRAAFELARPALGDVRFRTAAGEL